MGLHATLPSRMQVLRASTVASTHRNLGRQLVDGHWVLSFPDAEAAHTARDLVDQHQVWCSYCFAISQSGSSMEFGEVAHVSEPQDVKFRRAA